MGPKTLASQCIKKVTARWNERKESASLKRTEHVPRGPGARAKYLRVSRGGYLEKNRLATKAKLRTFKTTKKKRGSSEQRTFGMAHGNKGRDRNGRRIRSCSPSAWAI